MGVSVRQRCLVRLPVQPASCAHFWVPAVPNQGPGRYCHRLCRNRCLLVTLPGPCLKTTLDPDLFSFTPSRSLTTTQPPLWFSPTPNLPPWTSSKAPARLPLKPFYPSLPGRRLVPAHNRHPTTSKAQRLSALWHMPGEPSWLGCCACWCSWGSPRDPLSSHATRAARIRTGLRNRPPPYLSIKPPTLPTRPPIRPSRPPSCSSRSAPRPPTRPPSRPP